MLGAGLPIESGPGPASFPPPLDGREIATEVRAPIATESGLVLIAESVPLLAAQDGSLLETEDGRVLALDVTPLLAAQDDVPLTTEDGLILAWE